MRKVITSIILGSIIYIIGYQYVSQQKVPIFHENNALPDYVDYLNENTPKADELLVLHDSTIRQVVSDSTLYYDLISIVYPELLRYDQIRNAIEHQLMKVLYVPYGLKEADYSVGVFQMRGVFLERLEKE